MRVLRVCGDEVEHVSDGLRVAASKVPGAGGVVCGEGCDRVAGPREGGLEACVPAGAVYVERSGRGRGGAGRCHDTSSPAGCDVIGARRLPHEGQ